MSLVQAVALLGFRVLKCTAEYEVQEAGDERILDSAEDIDDFNAELSD